MAEFILKTDNGDHGTVEVYISAYGAIESIKKHLTEIALMSGSATIHIYTKDDRPTYFDSMPKTGKKREPLTGGPCVIDGRTIGKSDQSK